MSTAEAQSPLGWRDRAPLFVIAGSHGSLHWSLAIFYLLLPFIKDEYGMSYAEIGMLASIVHAYAFAINIPSGVLVDVTGKGSLCQLTALVFCGFGLIAIGWATEFWMLAVFIGIVGAMNTLWHPAAISFLSSAYADRRGLALSFHTVGGRDDFNCWLARDGGGGRHRSAHRRMFDAFGVRSGRGDQPRQLSPWGHARLYNRDARANLSGEHLEGLHHVRLSGHLPSWTAYLFTIVFRHRL